MKFPLWRRRQKEELEEELRAHLHAAIRERMERGEPREQAEAATDHGHVYSGAVSAHGCCGAGVLLARTQRRARGSHGGPALRIGDFDNSIS